MPLVLVGPPGVGKKTLIRALQKNFPGQLVDPVRHTARPINPDFEVDGEDGHFVSEERLEADISNGRLFAFGRTGAHLEGISFQAVDDVVASGKVRLRRRQNSPV